jgi:hypothetical protein
MEIEISVCVLAVLYGTFSSLLPHIMGHDFFAKSPWLFIRDER